MSFRETSLVLGAGACAAATYYFYNVAIKERIQCAKETTRKNELAMDLCGLRNQNMESEESKRYGWEFKPKKSDVFIVTVAFFCSFVARALFRHWKPVVFSLHLPPTWVQPACRRQQQTAVATTLYC